MLVAHATITAVLEVLFSKAFEKLRRNRKAPKITTQDVLDGLAVHLKECSSWSSQIQVLGMNLPQDLLDSTTPLSIHTEPRRFRVADDPSDYLSETDLLSDQYHCLLLGEPGAGKTTTMKRLTQSMLTAPEASTRDRLQYPLVVRLRDLRLGQSLATAIADRLRLPYRQIEVKEVVEGFTQSRRRASSSHSFTRYVTQVGDLPIEGVLSQILDETGALVLLDGLDELRPEHREAVRREAELIGSQLVTAKMVVSTRSGDYGRTLQGFRVVEICPLSPEQIRTIAVKWLGDDASPFLVCLEALPYRDLAARPLLLTQLLFLFKKHGFLPEQPSEVYLRVVRLLLEEWDAERGISRASQYATFNPDRKLRFLAELAYHLMYIADRRRFTEQDLVSAYQAIHSRFSLPQGEARQVAQEIQTHNGIVVAGPNGRYEFLHLCIQEYLCATYIVSAAFPDRIAQYAATYAGPLAVAVALSSTPSEWFGNLIFRLPTLCALGQAWIVSFISRVRLERPAFSASELFGLALLHLFQQCKPEPEGPARQALDQLASGDVPLASMALALRYYKIWLRASHPRELVDLVPDTKASVPFQFAVPRAAVPAGLLPRLSELARSPLQFLKCKAAPGGTFPVHVTRRVRSSVKMDS